MGRHRRAAHGATNGTTAPADRPEHSARPHATGYAPQEAAPALKENRSHRRPKRGGAPVRTGLLGVSAAVAMGAVAVATGLLPGGDHLAVTGDGPSGRVEAADGPSDLETNGSADVRSGDDASRGADRSAGPDADPSSSASEKKDKAAEKSASPSASEKADGKDKAVEEATKASRTPERAPAPTPSRTTQAPAPSQPSAAPSSPAGSSAAAAVLSLVNQERAKAGCSPVTADAELDTLATAFSEDMAARGFFDHTDPDGDTPWDRAEQAGVTGLGGENIARGQANAQSVMDSWMNSPGHRANILNCDYKTLGVGVHFAEGGPWWTQNFGF
ncbi:CAP domain-containing protein [Streptomyces sp. NPDC058373]|uniref:CAP domain-containing protein n=1 Tax=Streptomyces sp. NPDC058373 TaxID=3346465 RepID=UPI00364D631A